MNDINRVRPVFQNRKAEENCKLMRKKGMLKAALDELRDVLGDRNIQLRLWRNSTLRCPCASIVQQVEPLICNHQTRVQVLVEAPFLPHEIHIETHNKSMRFLERLFHRHHWTLHSYECGAPQWQDCWAVSAILQCECGKQKRIQYGINDFSTLGKLPSREACMIWLRSHLDEDIPDN